MRATNVMSTEWEQYLGSEALANPLAGRFVGLQRGAVQSAGSGVASVIDVAAAWPYPSVRPKSLACDAAGHHLVVVDGVSVYHAGLITPSDGRNATSSTPPIAELRQQQNLRASSQTHGALLARTERPVAKFS